MLWSSTLQYGLTHFYWCWHDQNITSLCDSGENWLQIIHTVKEDFKLCVNWPSNHKVINQKSHNNTDMLTADSFYRRENLPIVTPHFYVASFERGIHIFARFFSTLCLVNFSFAACCVSGPLLSSACNPLSPSPSFPKCSRLSTWLLTP